jgi:hypothetical protein
MKAASMSSSSSAGVRRVGVRDPRSALGLGDLFGLLIDLFAESLILSAQALDLVRVGR